LQFFILFALITAISAVTPQEFCEQQNGTVLTIGVWNDLPPNGKQIGDLRQICKIEPGNWIVDLTTLTEPNATMAILAFNAKIPPHNSSSANPATLYCIQQLGGAAVDAVTQGRLQWFIYDTNNDSWNPNSGMSMCVFPDLSSMEEWTLFYHAVGYNDPISFGWNENQTDSSAVDLLPIGHSDIENLTPDQEFCVDQSGTVYPVGIWAGEPTDGKQMGCMYQMCKFPGSPSFQVELHTLADKNPTLAVLAFDSMIKPKGGGENPAASYCLQLGGTDGAMLLNVGWFLQNGTVWDDNEFDMCVFPDFSAIDDWALWYHASGDKANFTFGWSQSSSSSSSFSFF